MAQPGEFEPPVVDGRERHVEDGTHRGTDRLAIEGIDGAPVDQDRRHAKRRRGSEQPANVIGIPNGFKPEQPSEVVEKGDLAYWPPGSAFCIFYGPTPASRGDEIRAASPVTVFGRLLGDPTVFKPVRSGTTVRVERA